MNNDRMSVHNGTILGAPSGENSTERVGCWKSQHAQRSEKICRSTPAIRGSAIGGGSGQAWTSH
jgi:hypothetical protein